MTRLQVWLSALIWIVAFTAAALALANAVKAQEHPYSPALKAWTAFDLGLVMVPRETVGISYEVGDIVHRNPLTFATPDFVEVAIETEYGLIVLLVHTTANNGPGIHADTVTVIDWPAGIIVDPMEITTPEGGTNTMTVKLWSGS